MSHPVIPLSAARTLHLAAQQLQHPLKRKPAREDLISAISTMALLQIDTISVVARSPYLVLFSRLGHYPPEWLEEALAAGKLFEYWAHEACFIQSTIIGYYDTGCCSQKIWAGNTPR